MNSLYLFQFWCLTLTVLMALIPALARIYMRQTYSCYERARWMIVGAMLILSLHYFLQMHFGIRAKNDDIGTLVNLIFYTPVQIMMGYCQLILLSTDKVRRRYRRFGWGIWIIMCLICVIGIFVYRSLELGWILHLMAVILLLSQFSLAGIPYREGLRMKRSIYSEQEPTTNSFYVYMYSGSIWLYTMVIWIPIAVFSLRILIIWGPLCMLGLLVYIISFIALGFNLEPVANTIAETDQMEQSVREHPVTDLRAIETTVEQWVLGQTYVDSTMTIHRALEEMHLSQPELNAYLLSIDMPGYRQWIAYLRIEAGKRFLLENPNYTVEAIGEMCGFSDRSNFTRAFKSHTDLTPSQWLKKSQNG